MELKKNPAKDIHRKSGMFFQIGLGISITLMITAFEWRTPVEKARPKIVDVEDNTVVLIPVTEHELIEPPMPSPEKKEIHKPLSPTIVASEPVTSTVSTSETNPVIDESQLTSNNVKFETDTAEVCTGCWTSFPEKQAEPLGGYKAFYTFIQKNLKYPARARKAEIEGKTFVEFIVNNDGAPTEFKVIKGIGGGCDEEVIRVIGLTRWNPGKQRGRPVRVKMVLTIQYKLN